VSAQKDKLPPLIDVMIVQHLLSFQRECGQSLSE